jgi:chaperonin GroES
MSVGDGIIMPDGSRVALQLTVGARVIFSSYGGEAINIDDEEYLLMRESDVLAVIE